MTGTCTVGHYVRVVNSDGTVVCGRAVAGIVQPNGTVYSGGGFNPVRNGLGSYTVTVPVGTFSQQISVVPTITPIFTNHTAFITGFVQNADGSASLTVDFGGVDTYFALTLQPVT